MMVVISLGGSLIVPDKINVNYLRKFSTFVKNFVNNGNKVIVVCGGGSTARKYIKGVKKSKYDFESLVGIESTKLNSALVASYFDSFNLVPDSLLEVKDNLLKNNIVCVGALGFQPKMTSDGDAAQIADYLKANFFINMTNVRGLYDKDPKRVKDAKFINSISFKDFLKMISKIKYKPGQHFVFDQYAANLVCKKKIKTIILSNNLKNLDNCLNGMRFFGTTIK